MPTITIDNKSIEVDSGMTILQAATKLGIEIPTLCHRDGFDSSTSCLVCLVKLVDHNRLVPACATVAVGGMKIESDTEEVYAARRSALELLLSDHLGDCVGPCKSICPADMNIPEMIHYIAEGKLTDAIKTVKRDIPIPAILGRICPAPCEKGCRRKGQDEAVSICVLKRFVADTDLATQAPYQPAVGPDSGKKVAIIGAGAAGLSAAYMLRQAGHGCVIFDSHDQAGGMMRYGIDETELPRSVIDAEVGLIAAMGVEFRLGVTVGKDISFDEVKTSHDAVLIATGPMGDEGVIDEGIKTSKSGIVIDKMSMLTSQAGVFACGDAVVARKLAVRAVGDGKAAAAAIGQFLAGQDVTGVEKEFTVHIGKLQDGEMDLFMKGISSDVRTKVERTAEKGLTLEEAKAEAQRCLHCDCRKPVDCKLRIYAQQYNAKSNRYKGQRRTFEQNLDNADVIFESGKCIDCGLCIQVARREGEGLGLSFIGRGFQVRVAVPFDKSLSEGLLRAAKECAKQCPTGALVVRE